MKIAVAQVQSITGDVEGSLAQHIQLARLAGNHHAELVIFPELSLTSYMTKGVDAFALSFQQWCEEIEPLQQLADLSHVKIVVGLPTLSNDQIHISSMLIQPGDLPKVIHKHYLHRDENPFFSPGPAASSLIHHEPIVALAICYELSVPEHLESAIKEGAKIYIASVAKHGRGVEKAFERLSAISRKHRVVTMMANCVGQHEGDKLVGRSAVWDCEGQLQGALEDTNAGVLVFDSVSGRTEKIGLPK